MNLLDVVYLNKRKKGKCLKEKKQWKIIRSLPLVAREKKKYKMEIKVIKKSIRIQKYKNK